MVQPTVPSVTKTGAIPAMTDTNSKAQVTDWPIGEAEVVIYDPRADIIHNREPRKIIDASLHFMDISEVGDRLYSKAQVEEIVSAALAAQEKPEPGVAVKAAKPFMYGILEPDGTAYMDEVCVDLSGDTLNEMIEEAEMTGYTVVPLYLHPAPSPDLPEGEVKVRCLPTVDQIAKAIWDSHEIEDWSKASRLDRGFHLKAAHHVFAMLTSPSPIDKGEVK